MPSTSRPPRLLLDGFREFEGDDEARVLVLTGEGPEAFCAGADLKAMAEAGPEATSEVLDAVAVPGPRGRWDSPG